MRLQRVVGHRVTLTPAGKFGHTIKPRCSCGWVGAAGTRSQARSEYAEHQAQAAKGKS